MCLSKVIYYTVILIVTDMQMFELIKGVTK